MGSTAFGGTWGVVALAAGVTVLQGCSSSTAPPRPSPTSSFTVSPPPTSPVIPGLSAAAVQARALAALAGASATPDTSPGSTESSVRVQKPGPLATHIDITRHADGQASGVFCFVLGSASKDPAVSEVCTSLPLTGWDRTGARRWLSRIRKLPRPSTSTGIAPAAFTSGRVRLTAQYSKTALLLEALPIGASTSATPAAPSP
jgi:hypothetical protein